MLTLDLLVLLIVLAAGALAIAGGLWGLAERRNTVAHARQPARDHVQGPRSAVGTRRLAVRRARVADGLGRRHERAVELRRRRGPDGGLSRRPRRDRPLDRARRARGQRHLLRAGVPDDGRPLHQRPRPPGRRIGRRVPRARESRRDEPARFPGDPGCGPDPDLDETAAGSGAQFRQPRVPDARRARRRTKRPCR